MRRWLQQRLHISWIIAWFSLAFLGGIALAKFQNPRLATMPLLLVACVCIIVAVMRRPRWAILCAVIAGLLFGLARGDSEQVALRRYQPFLQRTVTVQGVISEDPSTGPSGEHRLSLTSIKLNDTHLHGRIWVSVATGAALRRSDTVTVQGRLQAGFGTYAATMNRPQLITIQRTSKTDLGLQARNWFTAGIRRVITEPQASLGAGYLTGERSALPADFDTQLKTVGLTHAVVASGYNLTILVALARRLLLSTSKYLATLASGGMILGFIAVAGMSPSMSRAGLVTGLSLAAWHYGRTIHPFVLLPFTAACTALCNPSYVWGDLGWYLSFLSFVGVIVLAPLIQTLFWRHKQPGVVRQTVVDTFSAQLATMPLILYTFGQYSPYALLANIAVLPLVPLTMACTFVGGLAGAIAPCLSWLALPASWLLHYMTAIVTRIAGLPGAQKTFFLNTAGLAASYVAIAVIVALLIWKTDYNFRAAPDKIDDQA